MQTGGRKSRQTLTVSSVTSTGSVPDTTGANVVPTAVAKKIFFPKTKMGEWIQKNLTTSCNKYKNVDKIVDD